MGEVEEVEARGFWCSTSTRDGLTGLVSSSISRGHTVSVVPKLCCSFGEAYLPEAAMPGRSTEVWNSETATLQYQVSLWCMASYEFLDVMH